MWVKSVSSQTEGAVTDITAETLAVKEVALCTQSLHHVHPLGAEVADVAAAEPRREVLTYHTLRGTRPEKVTEMLADAFQMCFLGLLFISKPARTQNQPVTRSNGVLKL